MRNLLYRLNDGSVVKTMYEAKASGQPYATFLEDIPFSNPKDKGKYVGKIGKGRK